MEGVEAAVGVFLVRVGLALVALAWCLWLMLALRRLSERLEAGIKGRMNLPADLVAKVNGLTHQVTECVESLTTHINKSAAREGAEQKRKLKAAATAGEAPGPTPGDEPPMSQEEFALRIGRGRRAG